MAKFTKGQSGNPSGRPKVDFEVKEAARLHGSEALEALVLLLRGEDARIKLGAAKELLDRGFGKAIQGVELSGVDGKDLSIAVSYADKG